MLYDLSWMFSLFLHFARTRVFLTYSYVVRQALGISPCQIIREQLICEINFSADPLPLRSPKAQSPHAPSNLNEIAIFAAQTNIYL